VNDPQQNRCGKNDDEDLKKMMLRLVIGIIVTYLLYKLIRKAFPKAGTKPVRANTKEQVAGEELVEDPECHTYVPMSQAVRAEIDGKRVYFCSQKCLERYRKN
jgi:YHS domain-containing protein